MANPEKQSLMAETSPLPLPKTIAQANAPDASKAMTLFVMIVVTLYFGKEVLVPVTLALLLAFVLAPVVGLLRRLHLGRVPSVLLGVVLALGVILGIGGVIGSQIADLSGELPKYAATVETKISGVKAYTLGRLADLADRMGPKKPPPVTRADVLPTVATPLATAPSVASSAPASNIGRPPTNVSPLSLVE